MDRMTTWRTMGLAALALAIGLLPGGARAGDPAPAAAAWQRALDNSWYKVFLDVRSRIELADFEGLDSSQAYTVRTRLGLGTKPWHGLSAFAEAENVFSFDGDEYFDTAHAPNGKSPVADPETTELNRLWVQYANPEAFGLLVSAGRRRFVLDDHRFIGNVGWRQNEQTFDMALLETSLGVPSLKLTYAWLEEAHRIFGNDGPAAQRDFDSNSHVVHAAWSPHALARLSAFAYLLDFDNSPGNSSSSYGFRLSGQRELGRGFGAGYAVSWAYQTDAAANPVDYAAHYANAEASLGWARLGTFSVGFELLGSDEGRARFVTPLATLHKFNGFADVFLDNGGPNGLQDLYAGFAPKLPFALAGSLVYHRFWADEGGRALGHEVDFVVERKLTKHLSVLSKGAWFEGSDAGPADRFRWWLDFTFSY